MRRVAAAIAGLGLAACSGEAVPPALEAKYADEWLSFVDPSVGDHYRAVNLYETERRLAGRLVLADGSAVALRVLPPFPGDDLSFIAPALGLSYAARRQANGEWRGQWVDPEHGEATVTLAPASAAPTEARGQFAILPDGRRMHIACEGEGAPVVLLDYGAGGTMKKDWGEIAAAIADKAQTRVCLYDRAGRGLSDPGPMPRDAAAVVADMDGMLAAANIPPPYVLVGHSLGSYHVRLYANTHTEKIAGMVLVDPSGDGQAERFNAAIPKVQAIQDAAFKAQAELNCITRLRQTPVPPDDPLAQQCGGNDPDAIEATKSEVEQMPGASTQQLVASRRSYGDMPLIVLTRTDYETGMPPEFTAEDRAAMRQVWETMHAEMAALSDKGERRFIPAAGHYIQRDAPAAVIGAATDVVAAVRAASR